MGLEEFASDGDYVDPESVPKEDLIWLAGFIDGEGYFGIFANNGVTVIMEVKQTYSQKNERVLKELKDTYKMGSRGASKTNNTISWRVESKQHLKLLLQEVNPYLRIKDEEAQVMLNALKEMGDMNTRTEKGMVIGRKYKERLQKLRQDKSDEQID